MPIHIFSREKEKRARGREEAKVTFKKLIHEDISEDLHLRKKTRETSTRRWFQGRKVFLFA